MGAIFNGAVFSMKTITSSVFCEVLHSEAIHRKCDSAHQDVVFFRRRFIDYGRKKKKGEAEAGALHGSRCGIF